MKDLKHGDFCVAWVRSFYPDSICVVLGDGEFQWYSSYGAAKSQLSPLDLFRKTVFLPGWLHRIDDKITYVFKKPRGADPFTAKRNELGTLLLSGFHLSSNNRVPPNVHDYIAEFIAETERNEKITKTLNRH